MASTVPEANAMQHAVGGNEFEAFEVTEVDGAILWDLLEELENEEKMKDNTGYVVAKSQVAVGEPYNFMTDGKLSLGDHGISTPESNSNWVEMYHMEAEPSYEIEAWFKDDMEEMVDFGYSVGDYLQLHNGDYDIGVSSNEITYNGLWGES